VTGIGPVNDRVKVCCLTTWLHPKNMVGEDGFEPPNPKELIYSQPRLATSLFAHNFNPYEFGMVDATGFGPVTPAL
jgi:hypothetical protein